MMVDILSRPARLVSFVLPGQPGHLIGREIPEQAGDD